MDARIISLLLIIASLLTLGLANYAWRRRHLGNWALPFSWLTLAATIWSFGYAIEIASPLLAQKIFWGQIQYIGIATVPTVWFLFALSYTNRDQWLTRERLILLFVVPFLTILFAFTNNLFHLIWQTVALDSAGLFPILQVTYGSWFWLHSAYSYALMLIGTAAILMAFFRYPSAYRWQNISLLLGALLPFVGNILFLTGVNPLPGIDLSPFGLGLSGLLLSIAIFRTGLFDLVPIARRVAVENLSDALLVLDGSRRIVDINPAGQALFTGSEKSLVGQSVDQLPEFGPALRQALSRTGNEETEIAIGLRDYDARVSFLHDQNGRLSGHLVSLRDVTLRKRTESLLASRNHILETLNTLSEEVTSTLDIQTILNVAVQTATQLLGVTSAYISEWNEEDSTLTVLAEYYAPEASAAERVSDLGVSYDARDFSWPSSWLHDSQDLYVQHVDSPDITAAERAHMVQFGGQTIVEVPLQAKGKPIGTLELWESRARRDFSREEIRLVLAIARQVALAMQNARLYEQAVAASNVKSDILSQVNHELRTPLSIIMLFAGMLEQDIYGELPAKHKNAIQRISHNANYLKALVTQLLDQAEIDSGQVGLHLAPFNPVALAEDVHKQMNSLADAKNLWLAFTVKDDFPTLVLGDAIRIQQILINLVGNAIKFTDVGTVEIRLCRPDSEHWSIEIQDTGHGIAESHINQIFEPFWQATDSSLAESKGVGLGLSIVKQLVTQMNGNIQVESQPGVGTTFIVTLPFILAQDTDS